MTTNIIIDGVITHFTINDKGVVVNTKTSKTLKGTMRDGYRYYDLRFNNTKKSKSGHRLVAEAFLENSINLPCVHHKDGDRTNNCLDNLEWISYHDNNLSINKHSSCTVQTIDDTRLFKSQANESWTNYLNTNYLISTSGRIKNSNTGKILKGKITESGYREYCLTIDKKKISLLAHRIIYSAFFPCEILLTINHIDGNKLNNSIDNLENISQRDNNIKSIYDTKTKQYKAVMQLDAECNIVQVFLNCAEAARSMHCSPQSINAAIHNNYCSCGYYWKYKEN